MTTRSKPKRPVTNDSYVGFVRRTLSAMSKRVGAGDIAALPDLVKLRDELDVFIDDAVRQLRGEPHNYSLADIAKVLGVSRAAVQKRWGHLGATRKPGGQPARLR